MSEGRSNRRELLVSFLGSTVALSLSGCPAKWTPLPPGEIVGPSVFLGHRFRDGWRPRPAADAWETCETVIVGGGVAGLAAGWRLTHAGHRDFVLFELEAELGGTARGGESSVGGYPWGAHYVPVPLADNRLLIRLLREAGIVEGLSEDGSPLVAEQHRCRDPQERLFFRGRWMEGLYLHSGATAEDEEQFRRFQQEVGTWAACRDGRGRRAFTIPIANGSDDPEVTRLDRLSMADWLRQRGYNSRRLLWLIDYACRDDYGLTADQTSAWAGLFYFASRLRDATAEPQPLMTWPEGNARLVRWLRQPQCDRIRTGWMVTEISPLGSDEIPEEIAVVAVNADGRTVRGVRARRVIVAVPQFLAVRLVSDWRERPPPARLTFHYGSWVVANLHLRNRPKSRGFPLAWDNVLYESPSLGYVVNTHQQGRDYGPMILTYYFPLTDSDPRQARQRLLSTDRDDWAEVIFADLGQAHPELRTLTTRLDVMRWGHAMIRPTPGFLWGTGRRQAAQPYRGIHFAGADLSGVPLFEEALYHGVRAAEERLAAVGLLSETWLEPPRG